MKKFGIIGSPLDQSPSKEWFTKYFSENNIDASFELFEISFLQELKSFLKQEELDGLLVTIPLKKAAFHLSDSSDLFDLPATNMLSITRDNGDIHVQAHNTDYLAFQQDIELLNADLRKPALVVGKGGAAQAVCYALDKMNVAYISWGRVNTAQGLVWEDISDEKLSGLGLIVNTTPLGMGKHIEEFPPLNYAALTAGCLAYDLVYNPEKTVFLQKCEEASCRIRNGKEMLMRIYKLALEEWNLI